MLPGDGKDVKHWGHYDGNSGCPGMTKLIEKANRSKEQHELDAEFQEHRRRGEEQANVLCKLQESENATLARLQKDGLGKSFFKNDRYSSDQNSFQNFFLLTCSRFS